MALTVWVSEEAAIFVVFNLFEDELVLLVRDVRVFDSFADDA